MAEQERREHRARGSSRNAGVALLMAGAWACTHSPRARNALADWSTLAPESIDWEKAGYSDDEWYVSAEGGGVAVAGLPWSGSDPLPFSVTPQTSESGMDLTGDRRIMAVPDGFVVGFDAGEFGGGLWWFSKDGSRRQKLTLRKTASLEDYIAENVHALVPFGDDVLAFQGLTHIANNDGRVVRLRRDQNGEWKPSLFVALPACPHAVVQESQASWLIATTGGVLRLDAGGAVVSVWEPAGGHLYYPNSITRDAAGVVYMGMRKFVVRLTPAAGGTHRVEVLAPPR